MLRARRPMVVWRNPVFDDGDVFPPHHRLSADVNLPDHGSAMAMLLDRPEEAFRVSVVRTIPLSRVAVPFVARSAIMVLVVTCAVTGGDGQRLRVHRYCCRRQAANGGTGKSSVSHAMSPWFRRAG
jgi:hypothetical protein